jgi:hypothetical protein
MALAHALQKTSLIAAVVYDPRVADRRENALEFLPYPFLSVRVISPETVLNDAIAVPDANSDEVVEIAIRKTFDIQIDRRPLDFLVRDVNDMDLVFANRERS